MVKYLLDQGADKDKATNDGASPLFAATHEGHLEVVQCLLEKNADKDKADNDGCSPILIATHRGHLDVVRCLLGQGVDKDKADNDGWTPMNVAAANGELPVVQCLLDQGVDMDKADNDGWTPMYIASLQGHLGVVRLLLDQGAAKDKTNDDGSTALHRAALSGHLAVVQLLLSHGAKLDIMDKYGKQPIDVATTEEIKRAILDEKIRTTSRTTTRQSRGVINAGTLANQIINPYAKSYGRTALHRAARSGNLDETHLLVSQEATLDTTDNDDKQPIHMQSGLRGCYGSFDIIITSFIVIIIEQQKGLRDNNRSSY